MAPLSERFSALERLFRERNEMAREWGLQMRWIVCPACGAQAWVLPPHGIDACPLAIQAMEQLGLKFDAERMAALRTGIGVEEIARVAREMRGEE